MATVRINGSFVVNQGAESQLFLEFLAGAGPSVSLWLKPDLSKEDAGQLVKLLNMATRRVNVVFDGSPAVQFGYEAAG
jgi:hypothetical protein